MTEMTAASRAFLAAQLASLKRSTRERAIIMACDKAEQEDELLMIKHLEFDLLQPGDLKVAA